MTIQFYNLTFKNKIILFYLLPYFIYLTKPLDIGVFQFFKYYYTNAINKIIWLDDKKFGKLEFFAAFQLFCNEKFKSTTICYIFKLIRQISFNFNIIFVKICEK